MGAYRETLLDAAHRAQELGATDRLVAAALANSRGFFSAVGAIDHERIALLERAVSSRGRRVPLPQRARLLALLAQELVPTGNLARRTQLSDEAITIARGLDDPGALLDVLNLRSNALLGRDTLPERLRVTAEALPLAERLREPVALYFAAMFRAFAAFDAGDRDELDRVADLAGRLADEVGQPTLRWVATWQLGLCAAGWTANSKRPNGTSPTHCPSASSRASRTPPWCQGSSSCSCAGLRAAPTRSNRC